MSDYLPLGAFAEAIGCKPNRVVQIHRCGLLDPWTRFIKTEPYHEDHADLEMIEASFLGVDRVRFGTEMLADPRVYILLLNNVDVTKFGPGWQGHRDPNLPLRGVLEKPRLRAIKPGMKLPAEIRRIARIPAPPLTRTRIRRVRPCRTSSVVPRPAPGARLRHSKSPNE